MSSSIPDDVLTREQDFFDREAAELPEETLRITPEQIERYCNGRPDVALYTPKDALFAQLRPLAGKRVLDYGCGHGEDSCLLAACGADVTAFDLSPRSIDVARRRAELLGLTDRIQFDVRRGGETGYDPASFDVVTGFHVLHHLHTILDTVYAEIALLLKPGGRAYFLEPVANSAVLRGLRRLVPIKTYATPDERQLLYEDFDPLKKYFARVEFQHFYNLERLHRFFGRFGWRTLRRLDYRMDRALPFLRRYYGQVMVIATR